MDVLGSALLNGASVCTSRVGSLLVKVLKKLGGYSLTREEFADEKIFHYP